MRIAIVDDDIRMYECLQTYFGELLGSSAELTYFKSGEAFLRVWQPNAFELIILDIFMDKLTGMDVAREIRKTDSDVRIAFGTTSNEFASESYEVNACYYLHKPFDRERVKAMLDRIDLAQVEKERTIQLPDGKSVVLRDIILCRLRRTLYDAALQIRQGYYPAGKPFGNRSVALRLSVFLYPVERADHQLSRGRRTERRHLYHEQRQPYSHQPPQVKRGDGCLFIFPV